MRRDTRRGYEPLGAIMQRDPSLKTAELSSSPPVPARDWEAAVGTRIAARARPVRLDRGVLHVRTATATWAQELTLLADAIIEQLRGRGVAVEALRFRVGTVDPPERPPWRKEVRTSPPEAPLPPDVRRELARIADPELRAAIAAAAGKNLGWQEQQGGAGPRRPRADAPSKPPPTSERAAARAPRGAASGTARSGRTPTPPAGARRGKP